MIFSKHNGYGPDGLRTCYKGGSASKDAERMEQERQARINAAVSTINNVFANSNRDSLYDEQRSSVYDINAKDVNQQYADAERANRFALARNGLLGGSANIDSNARLQEKTNEGLVKAGGLADSAVSDFMAADERAKQNLISMAQSGIDTGTAQSMALNNLNANAQSAAGASAASGMGSLFDNMGQAYLTRQLLNGSQNGWNAYANQNQYNPLDTNTNYGGQTGR